jgi:hypothetical protein
MIRTQKVNQKLVERVSIFENAVEAAIAEIDQTDGSRFELQKSLDSVRETIATAYGEPYADNGGEQETVKKNPFNLFGKKKEFSAGFWTDDGEYHNAILKGRNVADAKRFAKKGWGKNIEFDNIEEM